MHPRHHQHHRSYEILGVLGKGSFGQVLKVRDHKTGALKALKVIRNKKRFHHQAKVRERVWWPFAMCCQRVLAYDNTR